MGFAAALMISQVVGGGVLAVLFLTSGKLSLDMALDPQRLARALLELVTAPATVLSASAVSAAVLGGVAIAGARMARQPVSAALRLGPGRLGWGQCAAGAAGAVALSYACGAMISLGGLDKMGVLHLFNTTFRDASPGVLALAVLFVGTGAPLGEELFFRGFMQTRLAAAWSRWAAIGMTAAAFGLLHMDPVQSTFALLAGLYLGWLAEIAGSVRPAIAAHTVNNVVSVAGAAAGAGEASRTGDLISLAAGLAVLGAVVLLLRRGGGATAGTRERREGKLAAVGKRG